MLAEYSVRVKIILEYLKTINPWGCSIKEIEKMLADIGNSLRFSPFVGLVVNKAPTIGNGSKSVTGNIASITQIGNISYKIQGKEFCDWFNNLCLIEITKPKEGEKGFRLDEIGPECIIHEVIFFDGYGWLSSLDRQTLRQTNPKFVSKITLILLGKPLRRRPEPDTLWCYDIEDIWEDPALNTSAYRLVSVKPFKVENVVFTQFGWQKTN